MRGDRSRGPSSPRPPEEQARLLDEGEAREHHFPHRRVQLALLDSLGRRLLAAHLEWLDKVERELTRPADRRKQKRRTAW
jgi:hypothetical protein